ncbi:MAG: peptidoglycan DD-metalloendopeptidase family protein [Hyphomicrobiales bacterium]
MSYRTGQKKLGFGQARALLLAASCVSLFGLTSNGFAQDALLQNQEGEILLQPEVAPTFEAAPVDPSFGKKKQAANQRKAEHEEALRQINDALIISNNKRKELEDSVAALDEDRTALVDQLISTARSIQQTEEAVLKSKKRLDDFAAQEKIIKKSLISRRAVLSEVLAALQRMGKNPPPAIVVSASDTLSAVRSAILLGSVLPELRTEAEALIADLTSLSKIIASTKAEWQKRVDQERTLSEEQVRLDLLIKENQRLKASSGQELVSATDDNQSLFGKATNLRELIASVSNEIETIDFASRAAQTQAQRNAAKKTAAFEAGRLKTLADINELRSVEVPETSDAGETLAQSGEAGVVLAYNSEEGKAPAVLPDVAREVVDYNALLDDDSAANPKGSFAKSRGTLNLPVRGVLLRAFGEADGLGGVSEGITMETRAQAPVVSPSSGRVVFAGAFSGFDRLMIIDVGDGYHMVLAGMNKIDVKVGDKIVAGEPVASMGGKRSKRLAGVSTDAASLLASNFSSGQTQPILYVELRKNGNSVNSSSWWTKSS